MNIDAYLTRIGATRPTALDAENLAQLHRAHLLTVPFENLDLHRESRPPLLLDEDSLFEKIVTTRRGGYCYEVNHLFAIALAELGFKVSLLSARPKVSTGNYAPEFDHLCLLVELDEPWLADVGFGDLFLRPLRLNERDRQADGSLEYRIDPQVQDHWMLLRTDEAGSWWEQYLFHLQPRQIEEFEERNRFHQTSPASHFTRHPVVTQATQEGRITLTGQLLVTTKGLEQKTETIRDRDHRFSILQEIFGLEPTGLQDLI